MCLRYLGVFLLVWSPAVLHAQSAALPCAAPSLKDGYFVPVKLTYAHGTLLTYACNEGHKPAVYSWWATSTCQNETWIKEPQCIDKEACLPPDIPNAIYAVQRWYRNGYMLLTKCAEGYEAKELDAKTICDNGTWVSLPVCQSKGNTRGAGQDGSAAVGTDRAQGQATGSGMQPAGGGKGNTPGAGQDGSAAVGTDRAQGQATGSGMQPAGGGKGNTPGAGQGGSSVLTTGQSAGSGMQPAGRGIGTGTPPGEGSVEPNGSDGRPLFTTINYCRPYPSVPNAHLVQTHQVFLKYQCNSFYKQVGPDIVVCNSNSTWSQLPICNEDFCRLSPGSYLSGNMKLNAAEYVKEGDSKHIHCIWRDLTTVISCNNGRLTMTNCCYSSEHARRVCPLNSA